MDCRRIFIAAGDMLPSLLIRYAMVPVTYAAPFKGVRRYEKCIGRHTMEHPDFLSVPYELSENDSYRIL